MFWKNDIFHETDPASLKILSFHISGCTLPVPWLHLYHHFGVYKNPFDKLPVLCIRNSHLYFSPGSRQHSGNFYLQNRLQRNRHYTLFCRNRTTALRNNGYRKNHNMLWDSRPCAPVFIHRILPFLTIKMQTGIQLLPLLRKQTLRIFQ